MPHLSVHVVPRDIKDDSEWEQYSLRQKQIRLRSLQHDSASFTSRHESEANEPMSFWVNRLKNPKAWTVIMVQSGQELPPDEGVLLREDVEWVGFCVMIDGRDASESMLEREKVNTSIYRGNWYMAAVWLSPKLRGQGAGQRLVRFGVDLVKNLNANDGSPPGHCTTDVVHGNNNALELYKNIGFQVVNADATMEKEGRVYRSTELKLPL